MIIIVIIITIIIIICCSVTNMHCQLWWCFWEVSCRVKERSSIAVQFSLIKLCEFVMSYSASRASYTKVSTTTTTSTATVPLLLPNIQASDFHMQFGVYVCMNEMPPLASPPSYPVMNMLLHRTAYWNESNDVGLALERCSIACNLLRITRLPGSDFPPAVSIVPASGYIEAYSGRLS